MDSDLVQQSHQQVGHWSFGALEVLTALELTATTASQNNRKVVVVVLLTGGSAVSGPAAAGVAGQVYRNLDAASFFAQTRAAAPVAENQ